MLIYMIQDKTTNKLSNGGTGPSFTKNGKLWTGLGALKNHLNLGVLTHYISYQMVNGVLKTNNNKYVHLSSHFELYLNNDVNVIKFDTTKLTSEYLDNNFILNYYQQKFQDESYERNIPIKQETRDLLCL